MVDHHGSEFVFERVTEKAMVTMQENSGHTHMVALRKKTGDEVKPRRHRCGRGTMAVCSQMYVVLARSRFTGWTRSHKHTGRITMTCV